MHIHFDRRSGSYEHVASVLDAARPQEIKLRHMVRFLFLLATSLIGTVAHAETRVACTLVQKVGTAERVFQQGEECARRIAPASTFKLPLALIGFDSGLLRTPEAPARPYDPATNAAFESWRQTIMPRLWLRFSVIWDSQWITTTHGTE